MLGEMPGAMLGGCLEQSTQRNATNATNARVQDSPKNSSVPDPAGPVDKSISIAERAKELMRERALQRSKVFRIDLMRRSE